MKQVVLQMQWLYRTTHTATDNGPRVTSTISFTNTDSGFGRSEESGNGGESGTNLEYKFCNNWYYH